jgi:hypothetical protein
MPLSSGIVQGRWLLLNVLIYAVPALCILPNVVFAAPKRPQAAGSPQFKVGDRAIWEFAGKEHKGTVQSIDPNTGWITLKLDDGEFGGTKLGPASRFQKIASKKAKTVGNENPFETVEERASKSGPRTWSDQSGKFKIEGTLVKLENDAVTLKRKDGKEVTLPIEKLSAEDKEFLKGPRSSSSSADEDDESETPFPRSNAEASGARPIDVRKTSQWTYAPDARATKDVPATRIALGPKTFFEKPFQVFVSPENLQAVVVWLDEFQGKKSRVQVCNLRGDKLEESGDFARGQVPIAMSNDMSRVVAFSIASQERDTLYLYDVAGHKLTPRMSWAPHTGQGPIKQNIQSARFIDKDHLLTINTDGAYVLWDVSGDVKPRYQIPKAAGKKPAFSAGGRYFALTVDGGIVIVEALTGNRAGFLEVDDHWNGLVSFDPTGHQMALVTGGQVRVWDLTKREITFDFAGGAGGHEQLDWPDENTLLVDNKMVIDVPHRVQIWTYTGNPVGTLVGDRLLYVEADQTCLLASGSVPNDEARNLVKSLQGDDLLKIQPGGTVSLDVQMAGFQQHREKVLEELKKSLTANGKQIADGSNV